MSKPIVYDPHCPWDYEHDYLNVRLVGDKSKATHEATCLIVGPGGQHLRVDTRPIPAPPQHYVRPLRAEPERMEVKWEGVPPSSLPAPVGTPRSDSGWPNEFKGSWVPMAGEPHPPKYAHPPEDCFRFIGGAVWTGSKAKQMMESGKPLLPLFPETWPDFPGVPKPDYMWNAEDDPLKDMNKHRHQVGPAKSNEQINFEMREKRRRAALVDETFAKEQRDEKSSFLLLPDEREEASARWSAQLRAKVEERKKADAEAARYTPYWSPEEQSGDDL